METLENNCNNKKPRKIKNLKALCFKQLMHNYSGSELQSLAKAKQLDFFDFCEKKSDYEIQKKLEQFRQIASNKLFSQIQPSKELSKSQYYEIVRPEKSRHVTFNENSKQVAFSCKDKLMWWNFETDELQYITIDKPTSFLMYHPDSKSLTYSTEKNDQIKNINLANKQTGDWQIEQPDIKWDITQAQFFDDTHLIIGLDNGKIYKYNIENQEQNELKYSHCIFPVYAMSINKQKNIAACRTGSDLIIWDPMHQTPPVSKKFDHCNVITRIAINHAGEKIIIILTPYDHFDFPRLNVRLLDIHTQQEINTITTERVWALANRADDAQFALRIGANRAGYDDISAIKLFDPRTFKEIGAIDQQLTIHQGLCYSPDNCFLATTCSEGVKIYDVRMIDQIPVAVLNMTYKDLNQPYSQNP